MCVFRNHHFLYGKSLGKLLHDIICSRPLAICYSDSKKDTTPGMTLGKSLNNLKPVIYETSGLDWATTSEVPASLRNLCCGCRQGTAVPSAAVCEPLHIILFP